jgi:uncharacterized membrane protein YhhN
MTEQAVFALSLAAGAALADWVAVGLRLRRLEFAAKPAVMLSLLACALLLQPASPAQREWFVAAQALSLGGDVGLLVDRWSRDRRGAFLAGLAFFLLAHAAYIGGFAARGATVESAGLAILAAGAVTIAAGRPILAALHAGARRSLEVPVAAYMLVITVMVATAVASGNPLAGAGAALFYLSDFLIARHRFVGELAWAPLVIIVTYHLAQALLVLSLAS